MKNICWHHHVGIEYYFLTIGATYNDHCMISLAQSTVVVYQKAI